ncbi:MAG: DoxX family protein [Bacteroidetes bacterium]|nr:DoxX family protein [Bacteroidota bacterium]
MKKIDWVSAGLLVLRIGIGLLFIWHGLPKIEGGVEKWTKLGNQMGHIGIHFLPAFWGFMAAFSEFGGGILMILGVFFRPTMALMFFTMLIAVITHISGGDGFNDWSHAAATDVVFLALLVSGAGKYKVGKW